MIAVAGVAALVLSLLGPSVVSLEAANTADMEQVFLSGSPWMVYCTTKKGILFLLEGETLRLLCVGVFVSVSE